jgi:DNA-binding FadR family transcriptional regulator
MQKIFRKARQNRIFQDVVDQIQEAILNGHLKTGEKLPPERELGALFGTSRGTTREALRVLEQKGLVEIKLGVGGGAVVKGASADQITESLAMLIRSQKVSLEHLAEFREGVEGTVTGIAAEKADAQGLRELNALVEQAAECYAGGLDFWDDFVRIDEQVHMALARISGNPLYMFIMQTIHDNIHLYYNRFLKAGPDEFRENYEDLRAIVEAIARKDASLAAKLAREHVRRFNRYMEKKKR